MTTARKGPLRRLLFAVLVAAGALLLCAAAWLAYTQLARWQREKLSAEQLDGGVGRWVHAADADLYIREWGRANQATLLLTHGTGAWSGSWFALPDALAARGWHVVAVDLPPFGLSRSASDHGASDYSRQAQARRLIALIDAVPKPVTLVGHSFGAGPALEAALQADGRLRQLVLIDPALGLGSAGEAPQCEPASASLKILHWAPMRGALVAATASYPGLTRTMLKQFVYRKDVITPQLAAAYQIPFARAGFSQGLGDWALQFANANCESAASLDPARISAWSTAGPPVALIWGERDSITPLRQSDALRRWMPRATLTVLPGVGHIPHIEDPAALADALLAALVQSAPTAASP